MKSTPPYWNNPTIHNMGNIGTLGLVHALMAPIATATITRLAYDCREPRTWLHQKLPRTATIVDFGCGTGLSTRAGSLGIDTSDEMLQVARRMAPNSKSFELGNAETWGDDDQCDVVTVCFCLHETPNEARQRILRNAVRVARRKVVVMDIHSAYTPTSIMLSGEPFLLDYLERIDDDLLDVAAQTGWRHFRTNLANNRVRVWSLSRTLRGRVALKTNNRIM